MHPEWHKGEFTISTDRSRLNLETIHRFLSTESYWAQGRPIRIVEKAVRNSLCFGVYHGADQIGFARLVTDYTTFAWLADVFILSEWRGQGLSKWLVECIRSHPDLRGLYRWILATRDAHGLYAQYGFTPLSQPDRFMHIHIDPPDYDAIP